MVRTDEGRFKPEPIRVDLEAPLVGRHVLFDPDELTFGLLEDFESDRVRTILDALALCIVGADVAGIVPVAGVDADAVAALRATNRQALRRLKVDETKALISGVRAAYALPKS